MEMFQAFWRKGLGRGAEDLFKLAAEVSVCREFELSSDRFIGATSSNEVFGEAALQFAQPVAWGAAQMFLEEGLELALGYGAKAGHLG